MSLTLMSLERTQIEVVGLLLNHTEPIKPAIDVHKIGLKIPVGNGSPVTMNVGDNVTAALNTTITIRCPVSGVPTPSVTWHKDGVQIFEQDRIKFIADNNSLAIEVAMLVDSAKYTCRVQSVFGMDEVSSQVTIIGNLIVHLISSFAQNRICVRKTVFKENNQAN